MAVKPILFSGPLVRALLDGRKHQTRRVLKPQPRPDWDYQGFNTFGQALFYPGNRFDLGAACEAEYENWGGLLNVPYAPGDLLWVREAISAGGWKPPIYRADEEAQFGKGQADQNNIWTPSIHMPRWASRLTLRVTDIRVKRLQEISDDDALAEGASVLPMTCMGGSPREAFAEIWDSIHGPDAWDSNPWVCALTFDAIKANVDSVLNERGA